jgi:AcrR family transcriptional regulator
VPGAGADALPLAAVLHGLPPVPPSSLDPVLDAAATCFARYGVRRTSVQDVAKQLGVNRTTVYRQVGNIEQMASLLAVRETHRTLATLPRRMSWPIGPRAIVTMMATLVTEAREHPVLAKMLADERDVIGSMLAGDAPQLLNRISTALAPLIAMAMRTGHIAQRDPAVIAEWLVRICGSLILVEAPGRVEDFLAELLIPALTPDPKPARKRLRPR